jgi:hypothetical protein
MPHTSVKESFHGAKRALNLKRQVPLEVTSLHISLEIGKCEVHPSASS